jgi:hypothetical protein
MTPNSRVEVEVRITPEDMYRGTITVLFRKSPWHLAQVLFPIVLVLMLNPLAGPISLVVVGFVLILFMAVLIYFSASSGVRTNKAYQQGVRYSFADSGMDVSGATFFFHHDWCNFHAALENSHAILLCPSSSQMNVLPKRCFTSPSQLDSLRALIRSRVTNKVHLRS